MGRVESRLRGGESEGSVVWRMPGGEWGLVCGDGAVWAGEVPGVDAWDTAGLGGCSGCAGVEDGAVWWGPSGGGGGFEVLQVGGGCMYMAGSNWIGIWEVTSANVRSSRCGWLRLEGWPVARAAAWRADARM